MQRDHFHSWTDDRPTFGRRNDGWTPCQVEHSDGFKEQCAENYIDACNFCGEPEEFEHELDCENQLVRDLNRYLQSRAIPSQ